MSTTYEWTVLAHLLRPQGRKGEVLAELLTDFPERFADRTRVFLAKPDFNRPPEEARAMQLEGYWLPVGKNEGRVVLTFAGIDSITSAETLEGFNVIIPSQERVALEDGAEYIDDLVGSTVFNGEELVGTIEAVEFSTTPDGGRRLSNVAPLLTVVTIGGYQVLIPYVKAFLVSQDMQTRQLRMQLPDGLLDLNR